MGACTSNQNSTDNAYANSLNIDQIDVKDIFKITTPQNNLTETNLLISGYTREIECDQIIPIEINNLCFMYHGKKSTKIFINGHIFNFHNNSAAQLSIDYLSTDINSPLCYIPNIQSLININTTISTHKSFDALFGINFSHSELYRYPVLLLFDSNSWSTSDSHRNTSSSPIQFQSSHKLANKRICTGKEFRYNYRSGRTEYVSKYQETARNIHQFLYCGPHGIVYEEKGDLYQTKFENMTLSLSMLDEMDMHFERIYNNNLRFKFWKWKQGTLEIYNQFLSMCYLHDIQSIFAIQYDYNVNCDLYGGRGGIEREQIIVKYSADCGIFNFNQRQWIKIKNMDYKRDVKKAKTNFKHSMCYDGIRYVYAVSNDGFISRYDLFENEWEIIKTTTHLMLDQHVVWMEDENTIYCTDGSYWGYVNINDIDKQWINLNINLSVPADNKQPFI